MPLLFRESPLNSVWEGSGNVNALDVLRALAREPEALNAWIAEVGRARGEDPRLDRGDRRTCSSRWPTPPTLEVGARRLAGRMAACLQGALLVQFAPAAVADAFCATRLGTDVRRARYGTLPARLRPARDRRADDPGRGLTRRSPVSGQSRARGRAGACRASRRRRPWCGRRRRRPACTSPWTARPPWWCPAGCSTARRPSARRPCRTRRRRSRGWSAPGCRSGCRRCTRRRSGRPGPSCGW